MLFCPVCANCLYALQGNEGLYELICKSCPYKHELQKQYIIKLALERKQMDDVLGGDAAWENVDSTEINCPKCDHNRAYFMQIQIRSADEPMSTFYKCVKCANQWRDG